VADVVAAVAAEAEAGEIVWAAKAKDAERIKVSNRMGTSYPDASA
jgi:hypothetical protein